MRNVALDLNIVLMAVAHCHINLASQGLLSVRQLLYCISCVFDK